MAQSAKINALTEELIVSLINFSPATNTQAFKHAKDLATRGLRAYHYARTNQFDVQTKLDGLDEKFRVLNRDDLADALLIRLKELYKFPSKWTPESLSLLLQLSDRPVEKSNIEDLDLLKPPDPAQSLTWADIIAEDPLDEEGIWENIDYAAESSEGEESYESQDLQTSSDTALTSSVYEDDVPINAASFVETADAIGLSEIQEAQFWRPRVEPKKPDSHSADTDMPSRTGQTSGITELQAIREVLFMIAGLPTSLFIIDDRNGKQIRTRKMFVLSHAIPQTMSSLLSDFGRIGQELTFLRELAGKLPPIALFQTFEAAVMTRLSDFDQRLAKLQAQYFAPNPAVSVSLLEVYHEVQKAVKPLIHLAKLVVEILPSLEANPFFHLETLFDQAILAQMIGEQEVFEFLARIFFDCLQTYLKPISRWMEFGELVEDDETFFVGIKDKSSDAASLWHDQFTLRRNTSGALHAPKFLRPAASKIFNTGKSIIFLSKLGIHQTTGSPDKITSRLDYEAVCGTASPFDLEPFSELFDSAFESWIKGSYSLASMVLREQLFSECGLYRILEAFKHIYLAADGSLFQDFANSMFERMDRRSVGWNDRFVLTELAQGVFSAVLDHGDAQKLVVRTSTPKHLGRTVKNLTAVSIDYVMPWSITNVIQRPSLQTYQRMFSFLLQIYRTKYLLQNIDWNTAKSLSDQSVIKLSFKLRYRLIWFTDTLRSYLTETVIAPFTAEMTNKLGSADDIDAMAEIHTKYISRLQAQCLLSKNLSPINQAIISLLDLGVLFSDMLLQNSRKNTDSFMAQLNTPRGKGKTRRHSAHNRRRSVMSLPESSSDGDEEDDYDADAESTTSHEATFADSLSRIQEQIDRLVPFIAAGLRGVSRAGGEACWEMLADRLDWQTGRNHT
ncbi:hypothetical protein AOQ84DRAFT_327860 [Glonium stellatum]|uniref:Spindle pole body component n=1 Tax=Glonium stellatum TaxID=574774 RepID=A0A8E2EPP8_9PEZI|nr:hypothetical protein AOQ84DRAFT_327860 [Glonium stellatum]